MPLWIIFTILLCLWAIALEMRLRKRTEQTNALAGLLADIAEGNKRIDRKRDGTYRVTNIQQRSH